MMFWFEGGRIIAGLYGFGAPELRGRTVSIWSLWLSNQDGGPMATSVGLGGQM